MNRRESIRALGLSTLSAGVLLEACQDGTVKENMAEQSATQAAGRQPFEVERDKKLNGETFFTSHEMQTITALADIIIPADEKSGSASEAKVPEFIEFIVKDIPDHQVPLRGGLRWLDMQCFSRYNKSFTESSQVQQLEMINEIAYPLKATQEMKPGVAFFNRLRDLTASGFFTSQIGVKDLGYVGNVATKWDGVPKDVLAQYGF
ncbi:MAG: gluconate 2-dehydrogenase subunit 3 family protein [Chitinophagaceae bacterium]|nr:gluconate 2-dehydrogenase subunit 3 family protein [Chitinophagaceae bacterium]